MSIPSRPMLRFLLIAAPVVAAAAGLALADYPDRWTSAFLVTGVALMLLLAGWLAFAKVAPAAERRQATAVPTPNPEGVGISETPAQLVQARARAAARRAKAPVKTRIRRG